MKAGNVMMMIIILLVLAALVFYIAISLPDNEPETQKNMEIMKLTSPMFENNGLIPKKYTCDGENINPPLDFENIPEDAKSLVLTMDDPDVPKNLRPSGVFDHWVVFNIPPRAKGIAENEIMQGVYGSNSRGEAKYTGPCPPDREHRYFFRLFALNTLLSLPTGATKEEVLKAVNGKHILTEAILIGRYNREANMKN